jgi:hypothetical protein
MVNAMWMKRKRGSNYMELDKAANERQSQDMSIFKGLPVIALRTRSKYDICNADRLVVVDYTKSVVKVQHIDEDEEPYDDVIEIPCSEFTGLLAPGFCVTLHRMQGVSLDCEFTLYEWDNYDTVIDSKGNRKLNTEAFMTMRYVALSRWRRLKYINIAKEDEEDFEDDAEEEDWEDSDWEEEEEF